MTVLATTRDLARSDLLTGVGVDHVVLDDGAVAPRVRDIVPEGVDRALELVGTPTLPDPLAAVRVHGVASVSGMLSNVWTIPDFYPIAYLPRGVRLAGYGGGAPGPPPPVPQRVFGPPAARPAP